MNKKEAWFFGYGSLIFEPIINGRELEKWCEPPIEGYIEKGIDFLHTSISRKNAPTLCFDGTGRITKGKCWRAVGQANINAALKYLNDREGKVTNIEVILYDRRKVTAYCGNTEPDLQGKTTQEIAKQAVESENKSFQNRGGVSYIRNCKSIGINTPMIDNLLQEIDYLMAKK